MKCIHCGESFEPYQSKDSRIIMNLSYWVEAELYCEDCLKYLGNNISRTVVFFEKENQL